MPHSLNFLCLSVFFCGCSTKQADDVSPLDNVLSSDTAANDMDTGQPEQEDEESDTTDSGTETDSGADTSSDDDPSTGSLLTLSVSTLSSPLPATGTSGSLILTASTEQSGEILDVNVAFDLDHTCTKDLSLLLISPSGTSIELFDLSAYPVCSADMENTILDDEASQSIESGSNPYSGAYRPREPLANFDGEEAAGDWTIEFQDAVIGDSCELVVDDASFELCC